MFTMYMCIKPSPSLSSTRTTPQQPLTYAVLP
jgi:hypothetical protein